MSYKSVRWVAHLTEHLSPDLLLNYLDLDKIRSIALYNLKVTKVKIW